MGMVRVYFVKDTISGSLKVCDKEASEAKVRAVQQFGHDAEVFCMDIDEAIVGSLPTIDTETLDLSDPGAKLDAIWAKQAKAKTKQQRKPKRVRKATVSGWAIRQAGSGSMFCLPQGEFVDSEADATLFRSETAAKAYCEEFGLQIGMECQIVSFER